VASTARGTYLKLEAYRVSRSQKSRDCLRSIDLTAKEGAGGGKRERERERERAREREGQLEQAKDRKIEKERERAREK